MAFRRSWEKIIKHHEKMHYRKIIDLKNDASSTCYYQKNSKIENRIEKDINYFK